MRDEVNLVLKLELATFSSFERHVTHDLIESASQKKQVAFKRNVGFVPR